MKLTLKIEKGFDIQILKVKAKVRYWKDATVNDIEDVDGDRIPCRIGNDWCPLINVNSGIIINWIKGVTADIHYKVCDEGEYQLKDKDGEIVVTKEGYVPAIMCPEENGFGDYIIMKVNEEGQILNWQIDLEYFQD